MPAMSVCAGAPRKTNRRKDGLSNKQLCVGYHKRNGETEFLSRAAPKTMIQMDHRPNMRTEAVVELVEESRVCPLFR